MNVSISRDEWLKAVAAAGIPMENDQSAITMPEFSALFSPPLSKRMAEYKLKALVEKGLATRTHKWGARSDGNPCRLVAYRLVKPSAAKKSR